jgi:phosphoserine aminotransferase
MQTIPDSPVPLIGDMSSDIFSRQLDWKKFDMIYAGAQKNIGPSGATLVIIKESLLGKVNRQIPTILDYRSHIKDNSLHNTPSTFAIYVCMLTLRWLKAQGGLAAVEKINQMKAARLYDAIDASKLFVGNVVKEDRSLMNVTWVLNRPELDDAFNNFAKDNGCIGIKGHRSVGGFRASIYNAMPVEGVEKLISVMKEFENKNS